LNPNSQSEQSPTICNSADGGAEGDNLIVEITETRRFLGKGDEVGNSHGAYQGERDAHYIGCCGNGFSIQALFLNASTSPLDTGLAL
jgi:hypothetical protein